MRPHSHAELAPEQQKCPIRLLSFARSSGRTMRQDRPRHFVHGIGTIDFAGTRARARVGDSSNRLAPDAAQFQFLFVIKASYYG